MAVPTSLPELTEGEQFFTGVGIVLGAFVVVRFGGHFLGRVIVTRGPMFVAKKVAELVLQDLVIGRVPILDTGRQVTAMMVAGTAGTVGFWMMGGVDALKDLGRHIIGVGAGPATNKLGFDEITGADNSRVIVVTSAGGSISYATLNPRRLDP